MKNFVSTNINIKEVKHIEVEHISFLVELLDELPIRQNIFCFIYFKGNSKLLS